MLTLAGGAALAAKRKRAGEMSGKTTVPDSQKEAAMKAAVASKKDVLPIAADTDSVITGVQEGNTRLKRDGVGPNESVIANRLTAGNRVPPSMRGGALHAQGYTPSRIGSANPRRHNIYKKGGRTGYSAGGAAKRGVSPILLKGKK